ncbi:META domain-containing protein [Nocardioides marmoriginsengisoli]|uniref:META domain-containing protein n=1 Tax=Nocardioides marmoriginsengisoli TaxID=661483 RepID=A0A3N0CQ18_9ACTN|nr:META domain-containing protein [Nocardioides marmoriginsengisoli]RNL65116.1 META domain-containing protein [Nocardioides marmoriginsengisoli]
MRNPRFTVFSVLLACLSIVLVGCGDQDDPSARGGPDALDPGLLPNGHHATYVVTGVTDKGVPRDLVKGSEIRLRLDGDRLIVTAGCNTMSGTFRLEGTRMTVTDLATTEMGCAAPLMAQDTWVAGLFDKPVQFTTGKDAALISGVVVLALADRASVSPDKPLVGTEWVLDGIVSGESASSVPEGLKASFRITEAGEALVDDSCNSGSGPAAVDGDRIVWGDRSTTLVACIGRGQEEVQDAIHEVLRGATTYSIEERSLTVTRGDRALTFRAVERPKAD